MGWCPITGPACPAVRSHICGYGKQPELNEARQIALTNCELKRVPPVDVAFIDDGWAAVVPGVGHSSPLTNALTAISCRRNHLSLGQRSKVAAVPFVSLVLLCFICFIEPSPLANSG